MINYSLNIPSTDTGYALTTLLLTALGQVPYNSLNLHATEVHLRWENNIVYLVPVPGTITTTTGTVPDHYGELLDTTNRVVVLGPQSVGNPLALQDIVVAASANDTKLHLLAYTL